MSRYSNIYGAVVILFGSASCNELPKPCIGKLAEVHCEISSRGVEKFPIQLSPRTVPQQASEYWMATLEPAKAGTKLNAFFDGMSGSPVYDCSGKFEGCVSTMFWIGSRNAPAAIMTAPQVLMTLDAGRAVVRSIGLTTDWDSDAIEAGEFVSVLTVWGDCEWGTHGYVAQASGRELILFGHFYDGFDTGACNYAITRSRPIGFSDDESGSSVNAKCGEIIGTALYDGRTGMYGIVGMRPQSISLKIVVPESDTQRSYCIAKYNRSAPTGILTALEDTLSHISCPEMAKLQGLLIIRTSDGSENGIESTVSVEGVGRAEFGNSILRMLPSPLSSVSSVELRLSAPEIQSRVFETGQW